MNILGWSHWHILSVESREHDYLITASRDAGLFTCPHCESSHIHKHDSCSQLYLDTPIHGKRVGIFVRKSRWQCQECHRSFYEPLPEMHPKHFMTWRLVDYIEQQALRHTFVSVAESVGVDEGTVRHVFAAYQKQQQQAIVMSAPLQIGIDEVKIDGAMRGVIVDMEHHRILDILPDRKKSTVLNFLLHLEGKDTIEWATMDMWKSYLDVVHQALPQARICVDRFHAVRLANRAVEAVRRRIRKALSEKQRKTLMHDRYILLHRKKDLSASQLIILETWTLNLPELGMAYDLKETYCDLWEASSRQEAMLLYQAWRERVPVSLEEDFQTLLTAMSNWEREIFNYFEAKLTNAYTETLNGIIKRCVNQSRGASLEVIRAKIRLYGGLHSPPRPHFRRRKKPVGGEISPPTFFACKTLDIPFYLMHNLIKGAFSEIQEKDMSVVFRQQSLGRQIVSTLNRCGLGESDFEVIQKMDHDGSWPPTPAKTVFGEIIINVLNLQAVIDHAEEIGKVYRVNILMKNDQPLYAAIEHNNGTGVMLHPLTRGVQ